MCVCAAESALEPLEAKVLDCSELEWEWESLVPLKLMII